MRAAVTATANRMWRLVEAATDYCSGSNDSILTDEWFSYSARGELTDVYELTPHSGAYYHTTAAYWANGAIQSLGGIGAQSAYTYGVDGEGRLYSTSQGSSNLVTSVAYNAASLRTNVKSVGRISTSGFSNSA